MMALAIDAVAFASALRPATTRSMPSPKALHENKDALVARFPAFQGI